MAARWVVLVTCGWGSDRRDLAVASCDTEANAVRVRDFANAIMRQWCIHEDTPEHLQRKGYPYLTLTFQVGDDTVDVTITDHNGAAEVRKVVAADPGYALDIHVKEPPARPKVGFDDT